MSRSSARSHAALAPSNFPWTRRRLYVLWTVALCSAGIAYLTFKGADTRLNETLALGFFALFGSTIGSYVFGAVWHDLGLMRQQAEVAIARADSLPSTPAREAADT